MEKRVLRNEIHSKLKTVQQTEDAHVQQKQRRQQIEEPASGKGQAQQGTRQQRRQNSRKQQHQPRIGARKVSARCGKKSQPEKERAMLSIIAVVPNLSDDARPRDKEGQGQPGKQQNRRHDEEHLIGVHPVWQRIRSRQKTHKGIAIARIRGHENKRPTPDGQQAEHKGKAHDRVPTLGATDGHVTQEKGKTCHYWRQEIADAAGQPRQRRHDKAQRQGKRRTFPRPSPAEPRQSKHHQSRRQRLRIKMIAQHDKPRRAQQEQASGKGRIPPQTRRARGGPDAGQRHRRTDQAIQGKDPYFRQTRQAQQMVQSQQEPVHERRQGRAVHRRRQPLSCMQSVPERLSKNAFQRQIETSCPEGGPEKQAGDQQQRQRSAPGKGHKQRLCRTRFRQGRVRRLWCFHRRRNVLPGSGACGNFRFRHAVPMRRGFFPLFQALRGARHSRGRTAIHRRRFRC